jgi:hypothetical protein
MRGLCFYNDGNDVTIPTGFLARTGQQLLSLDISDLEIDDTAMEQLAQIFPRLVEISLSYCSRISYTALASLVRHRPLIHRLDLTKTPITDAGLTILAQGYPALKMVERIGHHRCGCVQASGVLSEARRCDFRGR